ncbi:MAG: hypothetical protein HYU28_00135 [Actinobacteria bacterium]|nr:hypothetical protein [Actinomycetota bacterium]
MVEDGARKSDEPEDSEEHDAGSPPSPIEVLAVYDHDGDGEPEMVYRLDREGDGHFEVTEILTDEDDDGIPDRSVRMVDHDGDGEVDEVIVAPDTDS